MTIAGSRFVIGSIGLSSPRTWFRLPFVYRPRAERRESPALAAFHWEGSTLHQCNVGNISSSGAYLLTKQRWNPGEFVSLTLQRSGALQESTQRRFTVQAKAVRRDRDGVGLAFLMPRGSDLQLWHSVIKANVPQTEPEDVVREFRTAAATAFIHRVSPEATIQVRRLLRAGLSNFRLESAVEIALHAEELLALEGLGKKSCAHPSVVLRILEDGSWAETEWIQHFWAGLLATSCTQNEAPGTDLTYVNLLSQLTTIQARIFAAGCVRASKQITPGDHIFAKPLSCSAEELIQIADTYDLVHIERDVQHLVGLGLVMKSVRWKYFSLIDKSDITPTTLALKLYARCRGHRGDPADFYSGMVGEKSTMAAD